MIREIARAASRVLPASAKAHLADWRFGHGGHGHRFRVAREPDGDLVRFTIDDRLRLAAPGAAAAAVDYQFVEDGDSRSEMAAFIALSSSAPPDALLLDVGAHLGLFSVVHLMLGPAHRAVLIDASPPLCDAAGAWLRLERLEERADVRCAGIGDRVETRRIEAHAIEFAREATGEATGVEVPFTTIDAICGDGKLRPAIIKIDVEGHEGSVIAGARETLRRDRPVLCLELHLDMLERAAVPLDAILRALDEADYEYRDADGRRLSAGRVRRSLKALIRITAHPRERG
jgi:FkbM family methyltransferase